MSKTAIFEIEGFTKSVSMSKFLVFDIKILQPNKQNPPTLLTPVRLGDSALEGNSK